MGTINDVAKKYYEAALAGDLPPSGGGGGVSEVTVTNFPATQPVSGTVTATGPLTNAQFTAVTGAATAAAWDGSAASATIIAILKSMDASLRQIATNTTPG